MKTKQWITVLLAFLLLLGLLAACDNGGNNESPSLGDTLPSVDPLPSPTPTLPPVTWEPVVFPEVEGFVKTVEENEILYVSEELGANIQLKYFRATPEQLAEAGSAWGSELEALLKSRLFPGNILSDRLVDLPGLSRKGLEVEIDVGRDAYCCGLVIPSNGQVVALLGITLTTTKEAFLEAYDGLLQNLSV